jgi:catechol 2,3-dioxygenase-like lactoylglutathione lyase family enzyme
MHLLSKDKHRLAQWYCTHLGFEIVDDLELRGEPNGPVLITSDRGHTGLSVFTSSKSVPNVLPAFDADPALFLALHAHFNRPAVYDHYRFFSFYVPDGDGNRIEICSTDYEATKQKLVSAQVAYLFMTPATYQP